ncbi:MAG: hypothetical protein K2X57_05310, partial [Xanthobacteraceae bacterium]|nr:hypothetical protein [Xanthobacteraceae bacterium]
GFVILRTGSVDPPIAGAIVGRNGAAHMHRSGTPRVLRPAGPILQREIVPRLRNRRLYKGCGLQAEIRCSTAFDSTRSGF